MRLLKLTALAVAIFLGGCESSAPTNTVATAVPPPEAQPKCPVVESHTWHAWVNRMPGPDAKPTLIVEGQVVMPTPGFAPALKLGRADRSMIPTQQLVLDYTAPGGQTAQTLTTEAVRIDTPAIAEKYKSLQIICAGQMIMEITDVQNAF